MVQLRALRSSVSPQHLLGARRDSNKQVLTSVSLEEVEQLCGSF
jgi:hypothetical protein